MHTLDARAFRPRLLELEVVTPPGDDPITVDEAKEYLRIDGAEQDAVVTALVQAATAWAENFTRRSFVDRTLTARFAELPASSEFIYLPAPPVSEITAASTEDFEGNSTAIDVGELEVEPLYGLVRPLAGFSWPTGIRSAEFTYTAGYGTSGSVPAQIKTAIRVAVGQMFEYRVDQTVGAQLSQEGSKASTALLQAFRAFGF